jgi:hypothetical protein
MDKPFCVAEEFSRAPSGLYLGDGKHTATALRGVIVELLRQYGHVTVDLDGLAPLKASYFREAFGGLVYRERFDPAELLSRLTFICASDGSIAEQARLEIAEAVALAG